MNYQVRKQVFNSKGYCIETSFFDVPCASVDEVLRILQSEGYTVFENEPCFKMLSNITGTRGNRTYSRYQFRLVNHV